MANITITQLPFAGPITGSELVPIVQNGLTVQTTTSSIAVQPTQTQTFLTATQQPSLPNSRYLAVGSGLSLTDAGAQGTLQISLTGIYPSLDSVGNGLMAKTGSSTLTARQITVGTGLGVTNGDGIAGNPQVTLGSFLANLQSLSASTGILGVSGGSFNARSVAGTAGNITVANGDGSSGNPTINLATTAVTAGTYGSASLVPVITVDSFGRVTSVSTAANPQGTVTSVTGTSPVLSSGGATPAISLASSYGDIQNPYASKTANFFLAAPNGSSGVPTFRGIAVADVPTLNQNTTGTATNITASSNSTLTTLSALSLPGSQVSGNISGNAANVTGTVAVANGGTGLTSTPTNGQLDIGNGTGFTRSTLTAGSGIAITNGSGAITIAATGSGSGTVTSVDVSGGTTGLTTSGGPITSSGTITLAGTLAIANGGTGQTTASAAFNALSPITTTGDLIIGNGVNSSTRLAIGTNGFVLTSNGTTATWAASSGGGGVTSFQTSLSGLTPSTATTGVVTLAGTLGATSGGTGFSTYATGDLIYASATNTLAKLAAGTNGFVLTLAGGVPTWAASTGGVTSFSAGTTGFTPSTATTGAITLAGTLNIANGGTGSTTAQTAMNAFAGAVTSGSYLRGNGTNVVMSAIQVADVPTLNQNTTGTSANVTGTVAIANGGTGATTAPNALTALGAYPASNPAGYTSNTGTVTSVAALTLGTSGTDLSSTVATGTTTPVITLNVPTASATNRGALSAADWTTFNNKGSGTVTAVSVVSANGFAGSSSGGATPALTLSTSITGVIKGNGTALSAATVGTDYSVGTSSLATGILKSTTTTGALSIAVSADFPTLNQNTTGTAANVTGTVAIANGGTGQTTASAGFNALSPITTTGDLIIGNGTNSATRLAIGANTFVLTSNGTTATWAAGGGGGLTGFTAAESTTSPNNTVYVDSLTSSAASTDADVAFVAKGTGATLAQVPDSTTAGGNKRGTYATDWQKFRSAATDVASGTYSVIAGGASNVASGSFSFVGGGGFTTAANRNTASGDFSSVVGGIRNTASATQSAVVGGSVNTASNTSAFVGAGSSNNNSGDSAFIGSGYQNTNSGYMAFIGTCFQSTNTGSHSGIVAGRSNNASANYSFIGGGFGNVANGFASVIAGGFYGTSRSIEGFQSFPACNAPITSTAGVSQAGLLILGVETTNATATVLRSNTSAASTNNQVILPNNSAYYVKGSIIANVTGGGNTKSWDFIATIKRGANAASTAIVGAVALNVQAADAGASTWIAAITADTTNGGLAVTCTGQASTTIRWVAKLETTEVTY
jgi:hypothetical protein